jgi:glycosyltransferase involved in cell wall biosynthesis
MGRVTVVTTSYPRHGGDADGHFVRAEALAFAGAHEVHVIAPGPARDLRDGVTLHALGGHEAFGAPGLAARLREDPRRALAAARFFGAIPVALRAARADEVHVHWPFPTALAVDHARVTLVSHGACVRALLALPSPIRARAVDRLLRRDARWRFVSAALCDELCAALPAPARARLEGRASVEPARVEFPARETLGPPWPRPAYVVLGRLVPSKRVDAAIAYAARTDHIRHHDIVLIGDGPERGRLAALGERLGLRVHAIGARPRDEALGLLAGAAGLLFASRAEGLSTALREAAHYGVPVFTVP